MDHFVGLPKDGLVGQLGVVASGGDENPGGGVHGADAGQQLLARHIGHGQVQEDQINILLVSSEDGPALQAVVGDQDVVAVGLQHVDHGLAHVLLVLDEEDGLRATLHHVFGLDFGDRSRIRGHGQEDREGGADSRLATTLDPAMVLLDNGVGSGQPDPGPLINVLGGEEGLKHLLPGDLIHANAVIGDVDTQVMGAGMVGGVGRDLLLLERDFLDRHRDMRGRLLGALDRVPGVEEQVQKYLVQLTHLSRYRRQAIRDLVLYHDARIEGSPAA